MERIRINRTEGEEYRQYFFLLTLIRKLELTGIKKKLITLLIITAILAALSIICDLTVLIGGYIVMAGIWIIFLIMFLFKFNKYYQKKKRIKQITEDNFNPDEAYYLEFNNEWIEFTADKVSTKIKWGHFRAYLEEEETIYILMEQISSTWSFSKKEIGETALLELKKITKEKLPPLKILSV